MAVLDAIPDNGAGPEVFPTTTTEPKKLTLEQIDHFNEKGYVFPIDLFSEEEANANRRPILISLLKMAVGRRA